jgi:hypothetical protein
MRREARTAQAQLADLPLALSGRLARVRGFGGNMDVQESTPLIQLFFSSPHAVGGSGRHQPEWGITTYMKGSKRAF